jgi:phosphate transport system substrate-binding protein
MPRLFCLIGHLFLGLALAMGSTEAAARDYIRAAGSSTVYPFIAMAAEEFGRNTEFRTPVVESAGTGGGIKLFCAGLGYETPDIANASRQMTQPERADCAEHGVADVMEIPIGYDGIVLANQREAPAYQLTVREIFLALASHVPVDGKLRPNPYRYWNDINPSLPKQPIEVYGPSPSSGTRDAFVELVMEPGCKDMPEYKSPKLCHRIREDGAYLTMGENDNLIIQKLRHNPYGLGIFGFSFLEQNSNLVQGSAINGHQPTEETIATGDYPVSRRLYVYAKPSHLKLVAGMREFLQEMVSERATNPIDGYMTDKGLIPLPLEERQALRERLK